MRWRRLIACALASTLAACDADETPPAAAPRPVTVRVSAARRGDIRETLAVTGEAVALRVLRLASPVAGRVTFLTAQAGDRLEAGQVVARVISLENDAAVYGFRFLEGKTERGAEEEARARRLQRDLAARDIPLRTPFAAVVAERLRNPGEQVAQNDVLVELFDPQSLAALAQVPVESAARIEIGMPAAVRTGSSTVVGHVEALAGALAPGALTIPVRIRLDAPPQPPLLHSALQVDITVARHADALVIPRAALLSSPVATQGTVMVAANHTAQRRTIQLGLRTASEVEVTQGLTDGDLVLTEDAYTLPDDTPIEPQVAAHEP